MPPGNDNNETLSTSNPSKLSEPGVILGGPLAVVTVILLNRFALKETPLNSEESAAVGAVGAAVFGYAFWYVKTVLDWFLAKITKT
jgi:hypothetical protein